MYHRKNADSIRSPIPRATNIPIAYPLLTSKFKVFINEALYAVSFPTWAIKLYLFGETYSIQPIQTGKLALFLKKPENKIIGNMTIGMTLLTDLPSKMTLPMNKPNDPPANPDKK